MNSIKVVEVDRQEGVARTATLRFNGIVIKFIPSKEDVKVVYRIHEGGMYDQGCTDVPKEVWYKMKQIALGILRPRAIKKVSSKQMEFKF